MRSNHHSNALLVELLIVVLFFMLASTVLLQVFASARNQSAWAELLAEITTQGQNIAEQLYAAPDPEAMLTAQGFARQGDAWTRSMDGYTAQVTLTEESSEGGKLRGGSVTCAIQGETVLTLPVVRYEEVRP